MRHKKIKPHGLIFKCNDSGIQDTFSATNEYKATTIDSSELHV